MIPHKGAIVLYTDDGDEYAAIVTISPAPPAGGRTDDVILTVFDERVTHENIRARLTEVKLIAQPAARPAKVSAAPPVSDDEPEESEA